LSHKRRGLTAPSPEDRYANVVHTLMKNPKVSLPTGKKGFGSSGLYIGGKMFAFLSSSKEFVVKLPRDRVDELVAGGDGTRFDPRRNGRTMKEWLVVNPSSNVEWVRLGKEAMEFVVSSNRQLRGV